LLAVSRVLHAARAAPAMVTPAPSSRLNVFLVFGVGVLAFAGSLGGGFLGDDFVYVARFRDMPWSGWPAFFTQEWSGGLWGFPLKELRPFAALSFMVDARLWGGAAFGWHFTNLLLLLGSAWCVMRIAARHSAQAAPAALVAGLVFVLHPVQAEPVAWITGRVDLLAAFAALGFWCAAETYADTRRGWWLVVALAALFVGIFSKEFCLLAPALLLAAWLLIPQPPTSSWKPKLHVLAGCVVIIGVYVWCRYAAFGGDATRGNASLRDLAVWQRQASYAGWLLPWLPYEPRHEFALPPAGNLVRLCWLLAAGALLPGFLWLRLRQRAFPAAALFFGGFWWLATTAALLFVGYFSPRHLHFTTAGLAVGAGLIVAAVPRRSWQAGLAVAVVAWMASAQFRALQPWREAGRVSAAAIAAIRAEANRAPADSVLAIAVPTNHRTAWLWSWSAPQFAAAPFLEPGLPAERVLFGNGNYYRPDWAEKLAPTYAARVARAPAVIALSVGPELQVRCRTVTGAELTRHAAALASAAENGLTDAEWIMWVQQLSPP
jgi:hypothetical protein